MRSEFVKLASARTMTFSDLCERFGISRKTGYDWLRRFRQEGVAGLLDRSRRPKTSPHRLRPEVEAEVLRLRREHPDWGAPRIHRSMTDAGFEPLPSLSSVDNILRRHREGGGGGAVASRAPDSRIAPNAVWRVEEGPAAEALDRMHCAVAVRDVATDFVLGVGVGLVSGDGAREEVLERCFAEHGLPGRLVWTLGRAPESPAYRNHTPFTVRLLRLDVTVDFVGPSSPGAGASALTALTERLRGVPSAMYGGLLARTAPAPLAREPNEPLSRWRSRLARWREVHNFGGSQEAGPRRSPLAAYRRSSRTLPSELPAPTYPSDAEVRLVSEKGMAHFRRHLVHVGRAFAGLEVELRPTATADTFAVLFGERLLGVVSLAARDSSSTGSVPLSEFADTA
jgi:hypothetical protein